MDGVLEGQKGFTKCYIDDIVVYSYTWQEHLTHIQDVLTDLRTAGLTASSLKCEWGNQKMIYLGHVIGGGQLSVPPDTANHQKGPQDLSRMHLLL